MKKNVIRITVCAAALIAFDFMRVYRRAALEWAIMRLVRFLAPRSGDLIGADFTAQFIVITELILAALLAGAVYPLFKLKIRRFFSDLANGASAFIRGRLKPLLRRARDRFGGAGGRTPNIIKGTDEQKIVLNLNLIEKIKENIRYRDRLVLRSGAPESEAVRYYYTRLILILIKNKFDIKYSRTPREVKERLKCGGDVLFDSYEHIRYRPPGETDVRAGTVPACRDAAAQILKKSDITDKI